MTDQVRNVVSWLGVLGIPSIFAMMVYCLRLCTKYATQIKILHAAQKAQMRSQLLAQYYTIKERGWVWADELDDWMNQYKAYHDLVGENGVLDARSIELTTFTSKVRP